MPGELIALLIFVVAVIALALYGLFALAVKMFGGGAPRGKDRRRCVFCGSMTPTTRDRCDWCGKDLRSGLAAELADLEAVERQLGRFRAKGTLKTGVVENLLARVRRYRHRLLEPPAARPAAVPGSPFVTPPAKAAAEQVVVAEMVEEPPKAKPPKPEVQPVPPPTKPTPQPPAVPKPTVGPQPVPAPKPKPRPPAAPPAPKKSWAEMLAGFMEERNIRWGELIGGLLIVGFSVALVLSLWETLEKIPYFPFLIFGTASSAIFGVGLYAHHRWRLELTSRGLLVIATLLVPLNFLAMAALSEGEPPGLTLALELGFLGIFALLVGLAGRVLVPGGRWLQVLAVLGNSAAVLLAARLITSETSDGLFLAVGCLPVACFGVAVGGYLYKLSEHKQLEPPQAGALFTLLGTATFALVVALGLLVAQGTKAADIAVMLDLSVLVALSAVPILACGLTVIRGTARDASLAAHHTAGTTIALVAMFAMLVALGLAWPHPLGIITVGAFNCAALVFAAFYYRLPVLHAGAIACGALVYLTTFHVVYVPSDLPLLPGEENLGLKMLNLTFHASSGTALGGLFVILGLVAEWLARRGRHRHGVIYAGGCGAVAVVGLLLVTVRGFERPPDADALRATVLYALYGAGSLGLTARWRRAELSYLGLSLLAAAPIWFVWWQKEQIGPLWWAIVAMVLGAEALLMGVVAAVLHRRCGHEPGTAWSADVKELKSGRLADLYRIPLLHVSEIVAPLALAVGVATAWFLRAEIVDSPWPVLAAGCIAAFYLLLAWGYRSAERTWVGSLVVLVGLVHTLKYNYSDLVTQPWLIALLAHATLAVVAGVLLDVWTRRRLGQRWATEIRERFGKPLGDSALLSSGLVLPMMLLVWGNTLSMACCLFWLAAIWLILAWTNRFAVLFAAHQAVLALAALVATAAWIEYPQAWVKNLPSDLFFHPQSLQAYGIALGLLSLVWVGVRIALRGDKVAGKLLSPPWPSVDWIVRHAVVWCQLLLVARHLLPGLEQELLNWARKPTGMQLNTQLAAVGGYAWILLAVLGVTLIVALWQRWREAELIGILLLAATVPCLIAGQFAGQQAVASSLRWGLAVCFVVCSVAAWQRKYLLGLCRLGRTNVELGRDGPRIARATLLITTALPVLGITIAAALLQFGGTLPGGPAAGTFFGRLPPSVSYLVPLVLVIVGLVGHAVRERSAGYAFSAGLVAELIVTLGYTLSVPTEAIETAEFFVTLLQLGTITAAVWAGAWLLVRQRLDIWRERLQPDSPEPGSARVLMNVQLGIGAAGNILLLVTALGTLSLFHQFGPDWQEWTKAAGSPLGWIALVSVVAAYIYRRVQAGRRVHPQMIGLFGMAVLGLLACSIQGYSPQWGYRTLMLGWAMYAWFIVLATWWVATVRTLPDAQGPPQALIRAADVWVRVAGILAVLLGLKAAFCHWPGRAEWYWAYDYELLWAAAAIAVASAAGATMAVWRRQEGWAFSAALGVNLAASLVVWDFYFRREADFGDWWLRLVQANVIASSAVALIWLAVRKRLYQLREFTLGDSPLLAAQTAIPVVGNFILLMVPVVWLVYTPGYLPSWMAALAELPGWLGLLLAAAAAGWYLRQVFPANLLHVLAGLGLGAGVLAASHASELSNRFAWFVWDDRLEYHTLTVAWACVGLIVLCLGLLCRNLRLPAQDAGQNALAMGEASPRATGQLIFPGSLVQAWVTAIGSLVLLLAVIHSAGDPTRPWLSAWAILSVSVMAGMIAIWLRRPVYVFISGLLINVIGIIAWMAWEKPLTPAGFVQANVLCLAIGSAVWSLLKPTHPAGVPQVELGGRPLPFSHLAARFAVGLLALVVAVGVVGDAFELQDIDIVIRWSDWIALAATAVAVAICLWDRSSRLALPGLYGLGLLAVGMGLCARDLAPRELFCHAAGIELAGFVLVTAVLGVLLPRLTGVWQALRIPHDHLAGGARRRWPADWFPAAAAVVAGAVAALSVWISLDSNFDGMMHPAFGWPLGRLAGPGAVMMLLAAAILTAGHGRAPTAGWSGGRADRAWRLRWQYSALGLGLALYSELGWVAINPFGDAPWLHRNVVLMVAAVVMTLIAGLGLRRLLPTKIDWIACGRRTTPVFGGLAIATLAIVLIQEVFLFDADTGVPMAWPAVVVVTVALAALVAGCIGFAVVSKWDPLGLSDRGRTGYVYAAEMLAALICLHLWLTVPELFRLGIVERWWMLIVMAVAFAGAGLSELFYRRKLPVLSKPLERTAMLLPLAPAIGYWFLEGTSGKTWFLGDASPAMWFSMGLFYGFMAVSKRSLGLAALAILTANMGLWVALHEFGIGFFVHPQLWLIPIALAALVAEYLNHDRLEKAQSTAVRYLALSVIYISSTADMFIAGVGEDFLMPLILMFLSVFGALAGILLRVRSFLYLGVAFLVLDIITMVSYAAVYPQTRWIAYVCGILLGAAVLALFAVFEKRRNDVLAAVERFKDWER